MIVNISDGEPEVKSTTCKMRCIFSIELLSEEDNDFSDIDVIIYYDDVDNTEKELTKIVVEDTECEVDTVTETIHEKIGKGYLTDEDDQKIDKIVSDFLDNNSINYYVTVFSDNYNQSSYKMPLLYIKTEFRK